MELRVLGPVEAENDQGPVDLGPRKQRALLTLLALNAGTVVSALVEFAQTNGLTGLSPASMGPAGRCERHGRAEEERIPPPP